MDSGDEEDQMAAMMGFSSFAAPAETIASKKRKTSDTHYTEGGEAARPPAPKGAAAHNSNYMPLGQPRERVKVEPIESTEQAGPSDEIGHTTGLHPILQKKLEELISDDLYALRKGVRDAEGRTVFFQNTFVEENPWAKLETRKG
jgi:hypothetical protein